MPQQREVTKCEWKTCWKWIVPYPCKKCRVVTQWCYEFSSVKDQCFVAREKHCGCEQGREFCWWDGCFGWYTHWRGWPTVCFDKQLEDKGPCGSGSIPPGDMPGLARWLGDDVAIGGRALTAGEGAETAAVEFAPPYEVREICKSCVVTRIIIALLAIVGLLALLG